MTNHEIPVKTDMERRQEMRRILDKAAAVGALTLEHLLTIPPTATSIEHHRTLVRALRVREQAGAVVAQDGFSQGDDIESITQELYDEIEALAA